MYYMVNIIITRKNKKTQHTHTHYMMCVNLARFSCASEEPKAEEKKQKKLLGCRHLRYPLCTDIDLENQCFKKEKANRNGRFLWVFNIC